MEIIREMQAKAMAAGLYAANMPEEVGGAGLDTLSWLLYERELGRANYALHWTCVRARRTSCWPARPTSANAT
jgi:acyl-CoA dehydrogenase